MSNRLVDLLMTIGQMITHKSSNYSRYGGNHEHINVWEHHKLIITQVFARRKIFSHVSLKKQNLILLGQKFDFWTGDDE